MTLHTLAYTFIRRGTSQPFVDYPVQIKAVDSSAVLRLYADEEGTTLLSSIGQTRTDVNGLVKVFLPVFPQYQLILLSPNGVVLDTVFAVGQSGTDPAFTPLTEDEVEDIRDFLQSGSSQTHLTVDRDTHSITVNSSTGDDVIIDGATSSLAGVMTAADKTKLDSVEAGATANASDALLLARANHTGTQTSSTISDFSEAVDDRVNALLVEGTNVTLTYDDVANTLTIAAAGGGGGGDINLTQNQIAFGGSTPNSIIGNSNFTYNSTTRVFQLGTGTGLTTIQTPTAVSGSDATSLTIKTGNANPGVVGSGALRLQTGSASGGSGSGNIEITCGDVTTGAGTGGSIILTCGNNPAGADGTFSVKVSDVVSLAVSDTGVTGLKFIPTSSVAPTNGMYLQAAGVVGLAANNVAAWKYGSNAFLSQTNNSRDLGEAAIRFRDIFTTNAVNVSSDLRLKQDIRPSNLGLDFINSLNPVSYRLKVGHYEVSKDGNNTHTAVEGKRYHYGLIAQEVKAQLDRLGVDFGGWTLNDKNDPESYQGLRYAEFISPLIKAIQELDVKITKLADSMKKQNKKS